MQIVEISATNYDFFCPVTGNQILSEDSFSPTAATVFALLQSCPERFTFATEELSKAFEEYSAKNKRKDPEEFEVKWHFLKKYYTKEVVCFEITYGGMACGPVSDTFYLGIDMSVEP